MLPYIPMIIQAGLPANPNDKNNVFSIEEKAWVPPPHALAIVTDVIMVS